MRPVLIFLLFSCALSYANCRPGRCELRVDDQAREFDYREEHADEAAVNDDSGQQSNDEQANENDHGDSENELQSVPTQGEAKYKGNRDDSEQQNAQYAYNRAIDGLKQNLRTPDCNIVKKRSETNVVDSKNEEGDLLFENYLRNQQKSNSKIAFNNQDENQDLSEQSRYFRRYYKSDNRKQPGGSCEAASSDLNRNRRETPKDAASPDDNANFKNKLETQEISSEEEEAAIKRHVKKLSCGELEQLLNSLSDDKRDLLKKIIDNEPTSNTLNKREITKKAGAVEENSLIESGQVQSISPFAANSDSSVSQSTEAPDTEKPSENVSNNDFISGQNVDTTSENQADAVSPSNEQSQSLSTGNDEQAQSASTGSCSSVQDADVAAITKSANKREANNDDYNPSHDKSYYSERESDTGYLAPQEEEEEDDSEAENDDSAEEAEIPRKREAPYQKYSELTDSERSLEDSFPNSKAYEDSDPYAASDMLPLVRVKRKNTEIVPVVVKKRAAAVMPDAKVGFVPYKADCDDEDNDEANEFDNNGFYDRTSNLKVDDMGSKVENDSPKKEAEASNENSDGENLREDEANLGSDTDGVLSGVEGVDENLMLSKQNSELVDQNSDADELRQAYHIRTRRSASEEELSEKVTEKPANAPIYHEIDSFGPLPQDRDTETSRFKRIRRVKQLPDSRETNP